MFAWVTPHYRLDSVMELTPGQVGALGLKGLLLDVDCTLKDHHATEFSAAIRGWTDRMRAEGVRLCLLSNGRPQRIGRLAGLLEIDYVAQAFKPLPFACRVALDKLGLKASEVGLVGDQVFADVMAGRLAGLCTILVRPTTTQEPWFTRMKRPLERRVLRWIGETQRIPASASS